MFLINTYQPTISSFCSVNELNNKNYLDINKYIAGNDNNGLSLFFERYLDTYKVKNSFDKFFMLLNLRLLCVGPTIKLQPNKQSTITVDLKNILQRLIDNIETTIPEFTYKDLKITFQLPKKLYYKNFLVFLLDIVSDLKIPNSVENYLNLSDKEKLYILKTLKKEIIESIKDHIKLNQKKYKLIDIDIDEEMGFKNYVFSFYDNSAFYTLKFFYKSNVGYLYNKIYQCIQKLNLNYSDYCNLTPSETNIMLAIYKKSNNIK